MGEKMSVSTAERFTQGFTYPDYLATIKVNEDRFEQFYESGKLSLEDAEFFCKAVEKGAAKVLVLTEDWCPDCYRDTPTIARIAEASGMELRVLPRDQHLDIMDEFLKEGEYRSIPVFVFYTPDHQYIAHWIERPVAANQQREEMAEALKRDMVGVPEEEVRLESRRRTLDLHPVWQQETVRELRALLTEKLGL